ncbi:MAG: type II toxin-antitoxin system RelE/ParE family toxin [Alphaproteobacteria bacterium]|nr:type II toxin-antitoxin system RelE/ParE family toxin [Alphaproteobacteria bacterium]
MIRSFSDKRTVAIFSGRAVRGLPAQIQKRAHAKLPMLDAAVQLDDLRIPPGNRLEALRGSRRGQQSIRINDQWRVCFVWFDGDVRDVEIVDYHR